MKKEFIPVVLGSDDNVYGVCRSFFETYNIKPVVLCGARLTPTMFSEIMDLKVIKNFTDEKIFIDSITDIAKELKKEYDKLLLIPCSDAYLDLIVSNSGRLEKYFESRFISKSDLDTFVTKDKFYNLCEKYKLDYPKTVVCTFKERKDIHNLLVLDYPVCLKPNNSNSLSYLNAEFPGKKKAYIIRSKEELKEVISNINKSEYKENLIIQEFVPGDDTKMRVVNAYSDSSGKVKMICMGRVLLEEYYPATIGNYAAIICDTEERKLLESVKNFLESINFIGTSNFDFKYDERDKLYKCFEINPRQGRSSFFLYAGGINLAKIMVYDLIYNKNEKIIVGCKEKKLWLNVPEGVCKRYLYDNALKDEVKSLIKQKKTVHTLFYNKDMSKKRKSLLRKMYFKHHLLFIKYFKRKR